VALKITKLQIINCVLGTKKDLSQLIKNLSTFNLKKILDRYGLDPKFGKNLTRIGGS
jgi:hypothetical protein